MRKKNKFGLIIYLFSAFVLAFIGFIIFKTKLDKLLFAIWSIFFMISLLSEKLRNAVFIISALFLVSATCIFVFKSYSPGVTYYIDGLSKWSYYSFGTAILILSYNWLIDSLFISRKKIKNRKISN